MFGDVRQVVEFTVLIEGAVSPAKFTHGAAFQVRVIGEARQFCDELAMLLRRPALLPPRPRCKQLPLLMGVAAVETIGGKRLAVTTFFFSCVFTAYLVLS